MLDWLRLNAYGTLPMVAVAVVLAVAAPPALRAGEQCSGCSQLGYLSVGAPLVEPPQPVVGDNVTLTFPIDYRLPGGGGCSEGCQFEGGEPYLEGTDPPAPMANGIAVQRRVVAAGVATVTLTVSALTEQQCYYSDPVDGCSSYFQTTRITASSGPRQVILSEPTPTVTPTPTPTPTPTASRRLSDDDGCAMGNPSTPRGLAGLPLLLLAALLLRVMRPRG